MIFKIKMISTIFTILIPIIAHGQDTDVSTEEITETGNVATLNAGDPAPFPGTLLDVPAVAKVVTDLRTAKIKCQAEIDRNHQIDTTNFSLKLGECNVRLNNELQKNEQILKIKDDQIKKLEQINITHLTHDQESWWSTKTASFSYGLILGTGLSLLGIYIYTR